MTELNYARLSFGTLTPQETHTEVELHAMVGMKTNALREKPLHPLLLSTITMRTPSSAITHKCGAQTTEGLVVNHQEVNCSIALMLMKAIGLADERVMKVRSLLEGILSSRSTLEAHRPLLRARLPLLPW